jgi:hypothetical protein
VSDHRSPPPGAAPCLEEPRPSSQKGGTLIAEDVIDLRTHLQRLCDPDGYRTSECPSCHHPILHMHDRRERVQLCDPETPVISIAVYRCAHCEATWRILPRFLPRHLWHSWLVVETATMEASPPLSSRPKVADRTQRRWLARLMSWARTLIQLLATTGNPVLEAIAHAAGIDAKRTDLAAAYTEGISPRPDTPLADLAALIHRLGPGLRLM